MSFALQVSATAYQGNGSTTVPYPVEFPVVSREHIAVTVQNPAGDDPVLLTAGQYTAHATGGGIYTVTTATAWPDTALVTVFRSVPFDQPFEFPEGGNFRTREVERAFDRVVMQIHQLWRLVTNGEGGTILPGAGSAVKSMAVWADAAAQAAVAPAYVGQLGVRLSDDTVWIAQSGGAGDWQEFFPRPSPPADRLCLAYVADVGTPGAAQTKVVETITAFDPDYVLDAGDNNYLGGDPAAWAGFLPWINAQTYLRVRGNHSLDTTAEINADAAAFAYLFTSGKPWWKRSLGNGLIDIWGVDTGIRSNGTYITPGNNHTIGGEQYLWLEAGLKTSTARHKLVIFHHPPVTTGSSAEHDYAGEMDWSCLSRADAILCGHTHLSEWLIWRGLPVINLSGAVQNGGLSQVRALPSNSVAYPVFVNDIDPLIGRIYVTPGDVVVELLNTHTRRVEHARSIYDRTPRATRFSGWIYPQDVPVETVGAFQDFIFAIPGHPLRVHAVTLSTGDATGGDPTVYSVQLRLRAGGDPITAELPIVSGRYSGVEIIDSRLPADAVIVARVRGWTAYVGTPARGLWIDIAGETYH